MAGLNGQIDTGLQIDGASTNTSIGNVLDQFKTIDVANTAGLTAALTVGTSAVLACANGASSNLANRKSLTVFNNGTVPIYWGTSNAVTSSTGTPLVPGTTAIFAVGPAITIYLISGTAGQNTRITELS